MIAKALPVSLFILWNFSLFLFLGLGMNVKFGKAAVMVRDARDDILAHDYGRVVCEDEIKSLFTSCWFGDNLCKAEIVYNFKKSGV